MVQELDFATKRSRTRAPACAGERHSAADHCRMDRWGGDGARQGIEELEGRHGALSNRTETKCNRHRECNAACCIDTGLSRSPKSQFFGLMGYHVNQARPHIRLRHEELCSHVESHLCSFLSFHIRSITWKTAVTPFIVFSSMPRLPNLC